MNPRHAVNRALALLSCLALVNGAALSQDRPAAGATLKVGDKAPPLTIEKWVKGEAVPTFQPGKVYVVEFWATWCGPCIASMPHLSALQKEYKDKGVTIIGCTSADPRNTLEAVEKMTREKGDGMAYTVAWDKQRTTNEAYMEAAGQNGIPTAFLVDQKGTIAWIGHPMFLDMPLELVLAGKWNPKTGPQEIEKAQAKLRDVSELMRTAPKDALKAWEAFEKEYPAVARQMTDQKFELLLAAGEYDQASKIGGEIVDKAIAAKDPMQLNEIAWTIVDPEGKVAKKDLDLAMKAAAKAVELTDSKDAAILDTLARVYFLRGDVNKAIELQTRAVELADPRMKAELEKSLDEFKQAKAKRGP